MSDLLQIVKLPISMGASSHPLAMEFTVDPVAAPYLVSSTRSVIWVPEAFGNVVRAAVRRNVKSNGDFYKEIVEAVAQQGTESGWGNVFPSSLKGVQGALEYLRFFDFSDLEIFVKQGTQMQKRLSSQLEGCVVTGVSWLKAGWVVATPKDKEYLGFLSRLGSTSIISVVHNPCRGIAVAKR